ncbi:hypothetical protein [Shinella sp. JR1-6]|uniref:hypothetical protein n=1 Tax=Shinella sp. JR1-6 TaxID=2527671 RepID=UPI001404C9BB|nr:hypothetical protein [Shinella sp. JR1-6]
MPLIRKQGASTPKELGLFWPMQTSDGMTVDVFIYASTLQQLDQASLGPVGLLKRHRTLLESIASEKFDRQGATGTNLHITEEDLRVAQASGAKADDAQ